MRDRAHLVVSDEEAGERIDALVSRRLPDLSRSLASRLISEGHVFVNGRSAKPSHRLSAGDRVEVEAISPASLQALPEDIDLEVVHQDQDLAVIVKPAGLVVHPAPGHASGTLANALVARFPRTEEVGTAERPGIVHRLDKDTSGLMVVALTAAAQASLQQQIASREMRRRYLALAAGRLEPAQGRVEAPIGRDPHDRKRMATFGIAARPAATSFSVIEYLPGFTFLEAKLHTGRTHQIRVHLAAVGHPLAGDHLYHGPYVADLQRQFLHAHELSFRSPSSGEILSFSSSLPSDLAATLDALRS